MKKLLQEISDGLLPKQIRTILYKPIIGTVNGWSFVHFLTGIVVGTFLTNKLTAFIIHSLWEIFQFVAGDNRFDKETLIDVTLDTIFFMCGFLLSNKIISYK